MSRTIVIFDDLQNPSNDFHILAFQKTLQSSVGLRKLFQFIMYRQLTFCEESLTSITVSFVYWMYVHMAVDGGTWSNRHTHVKAGSSKLFLSMILKFIRNSNWSSKSIDSDTRTGYTNEMYTLRMDCNLTDTILIRLGLSLHRYISDTITNSGKL